MENIEILEPIVFTNNTKTYFYDKDLITVEQAELVRELLLFKSNQLSANPNTFKEVVKSSGADFLCLAISYLLREKNSKDETIDFSRDKAEMEILTFVKRLPAKELEKINIAVNDFFCSIKQELQLSQILQNQKKESETKNLIMSMMLDKMMKTQLTLTN